ncbi:MAG: cytochrome c biogenesis protein CcsA [Acidimicrobiales bacterium]
MSTVLGPAALWATVILATGAALLGDRWNRRLLGAATATAATAVATLAWAFLTADWRWLVVVDNTRDGVGPLLRLSGLWAGPEGSLLLWTAMVAVAALMAGRRTPPAGAGATTRLGGGLVAAYALLTATAAWPFARLDAPPADGLGLQPVLEYPAMVWHPPLLYAGLAAMLVGSLMAAGSALGPGRALRTRRAGAGTGAVRAPEARSGADPDAVPEPSDLTHLADPTTWRIALALLALGLVTGSLWAGVELGWGGYWAWDPIESAGLVAWLAGLGALHASAPPGTASADGRVVAGRTAVALAVAPGVAAVAATTLTRIGVVASVHTFADQPALRAGLLAVAAAVVTVAGAAVVVTPGPTPATATTTAGRPGRRWAVATAAAAAVLTAIGAYAPVADWILRGAAAAIAGTYFTRVLAPVVVIGAVALVLADRRSMATAPPTGGPVPQPHSRGAVPQPHSGGPVPQPHSGGPVPQPHSGGPVPQWIRVAGPAAGAAVGVIVVWSVLINPAGIVPGPGPATAALVVAAAGGAVLGSSVVMLVAKRPHLGALAHAGLGLLLIGVAGTVGARSIVVTVGPGRPVVVEGMTVTHHQIDLDETGGLRSATATVEVDGVAYHPSIVTFPQRGASAVDTASRYQGLDEIQVVLIDGSAAAARYRITHIPRIALVWLGVTVATIGLVGPPIRHRRYHPDGELKPTVGTATP